MRVGRDARPPDDHPRPQRPIREVHRFVDPDLRRMSQTLDDLDLPPRLHELTATDLGGAQQARRAGRRHPRGARDPRRAPRRLHRPLRRGRGDQPVVGRRGPQRRRPGGRRRRRRPRPAASPTGSRTACAPWSRRPCAAACARRSGRGADARDEHPDRLGPRPDATSRATPTSTSSGPGTVRAACGAARRRCCASRTRRRRCGSCCRRCCGPATTCWSWTTAPTTAPARRPGPRRPRPGWRDKLTLTEYPFAVARAGAEHLAVHERSVHSLAYFYNWCFTHVRTRYSWKWDGDMVLTTEGEVSIADLSWQVGMTDAVIRIPRHGLYLEDETTRLPRPRPAQHRGVGLPDEPGLRLLQGPRVGDPYDAPDVPACSRSRRGSSSSSKYLDGDEFAHWTDPESFATSVRNRRKRREWTGLQRPQPRRGPRGRHRDRAPPRACTSSTTSPTPGCPARRAPSTSTTPTTPSCTCAPERRPATRVGYVTFTDCSHARFTAAYPRR